MTFSLSLYSGWRVKIQFKDAFFSVYTAGLSSELVVLLVEDLAWRGAWLLFAHLAVIQRRMWHAGVSGHWARSHSLALTLWPGITFLAQEKGFPGESFHCLPIIPHRKDWWTGRGTSAKQMKICNSGALAKRQLQATWSQREAGPCLLHR